MKYIYLIECKAKIDEIQPPTIAKSGHFSLPDQRNIVRRTQSYLKKYTNILYFTGSIELINSTNSFLKCDGNEKIETTFAKPVLNSKVLQQRNFIEANSSTGTVIIR